MSFNKSITTNNFKDDIQKKNLCKLDIQGIGCLLIGHDTVTEVQV